MYKIGIVTPYRIANYGTKLQAYALRNYLQESSIIVAEIIQYQPNYDRRMLTLIRKALSIKKNILRIKKKINNSKINTIVDSDKISLREKSINKFNSLLTFSPKISSFKELKKISSCYDCIICGSDQIWLPTNLKDHYYTLEFCSDFVLKGSYAASLGVSALSEKYKRKYSAFLKKLDFISIREKSGKELITSFFHDKSVEWVCDPTFLISADEWRKLESKPSIINDKDKYVFCYFIGTDSEHRKAVYKFAKDHNYNILSIANFRGYCEEDTSLTDVQLYDLSVNEFLYLIDHATCICTDSMHATIFSSIFESDFWTFERFSSNDPNSRNSRIYSLLNAIGLSDRLVKHNEITDEIINYSKVRDQREKYIVESKEFISKKIIELVKQHKR